MKRPFAVVTATAALLLACQGAFAGYPPLCPHVLGWTDTIRSWANGAPWVKVVLANEIDDGKLVGAKVLYRPYDADPTNHDGGCLPDSLTGSQYADLVWAKISGLSLKPDAVGYRNEFGGSRECDRRTAAEFRAYKNRLRQRGYTGKVVFGSLVVGRPDPSYWDWPEVLDACAAADAIETHEYFDLAVACNSPDWCFRHRDLAINLHPDHLGGKDWFIGEFGSDQLCNVGISCGDWPTCRQGWKDRGKLTAQEYINEMAYYRLRCHPNVKAVFVFQQGSPSWATFETTGTAVADYMKSTWSTAVGNLVGVVQVQGGSPLEGATVTFTPGGLVRTTNHDGSYSFSGIPTGTYKVTASKEGFYPQSFEGVKVNANQSTTRNFTLSPAPAPLAVSSVSTAASWVTRGQAGIVVSMLVTNSGGEDIRLTASGLRFTQGAADVSSYYTVIPDAANSDTILRGSSLTLTYRVDVAADAPLGATTVDGFAEGWPNVCPNGSFEEDTTRWTKTNATGGTADWALDANQKCHGLKSLKLYVINCSSGFIEASTGSASSLLLPIRPNCPYTLSCKSKFFVSGSAVPVLGCQQYRADYSTITSTSSDLRITGDFNRGYVTFVSDASAAYARVYLRNSVTGAGTTAYAWFDDVQLTDGRIVADPSADAAHSWMVADPYPEYEIFVAKSLTDGSPVTLTGVVTAIFSTGGPQFRIYIQDAERTAGMAVEAAAAVAMGDTVRAQGTMTTAAGERFLIAASLTVL